MSPGSLVIALIRKGRYPYRFRLPVFFLFHNTVVFMKAAYVPKIYHTQFLDPTLHYMFPASQIFRADLLITLMSWIIIYNYVFGYLYWLHIHTTFQIHYSV
jgi:hypothetical protein